MSNTNWLFKFQSEASVKIPLMGKILDGLPGIVLVGVGAIVVVILSQFVSLSASLMALIVGFVFGNVRPLSRRFDLGIEWVESYGLAIAVALLGAHVNLTVLMQINPKSLGLIAIAIIMTFVITFGFAKLLRISKHESCLLASGQAICGSAAVLATSKALNHREKAPLGLVIAVINFLGFLGVFITTWLAQHFVHGDSTADAVLIGNTLQSMGHVVAAGFSVSDEVGHSAVLVKMCRIIFLIPTLLLILFWSNASAKKLNQCGDKNWTSSNKLDWLRLIPGFIWGFLTLIMLNNLGWIGTDLKWLLSFISDVLFVLAMVAIGLSIRLQSIWQQGIKLLLLGGVVFICQITFTFIVIQFI